jgi:hypothetical protein
MVLLQMNKVMISRKTQNLKNTMTMKKWEKKTWKKKWNRRTTTTKKKEK